MRTLYLILHGSKSCKIEYTTIHLFNFAQFCLCKIEYLFSMFSYDVSQYLFTGEISFRYCEFSSPQMSVHSKILHNSSDRTYVRGMYWILLSRKMAGNKYPRAPTSLMGDANGLHHGGRVFLLVVVVDKHKQPYFYFTAYLLWCMRTSPHHEIHCHMLDKG